MDKEYMDERIYDDYFVISMTRNAGKKTIVDTLSKVHKVSPEYIEEVINTRTPSKQPQASLRREAFSFGIPYSSARLDSPPYQKCLTYEVI